MHVSHTLRAALRVGKSALTILDGPVGSQTLPYMWLRDACQCPHCILPQTNSKLFATGSLPQDTVLATDGAKLVGDALELRWRDSHRSRYPLSWIAQHGSMSGLASTHAHIPPTPWTAEDVRRDGAASQFFLEYTDLKTPSGLLRAYDQLLQRGLLFVRGVPNSKTSDEDCELKSLIGKFGILRETIYGQVWDVITRPGTENIAYTNLNLGLHADMQYMATPPRFQVLHCLRNRVKGGKSLFVDALYAAQSLSAEDVEVLSTTPVAFHYENDKHHCYGSHPTLELAAPGPFVAGATLANGRVLAHVNYSPPFQAPLPPDTPPAFFPAFARFEALLARPEARFEYRLQEGDAVLFDNRRMFHARGPFEEAPTGPNAVHDRWLKGGYFEADEVLDNRRMLLRKLTVPT